MSEVEGRTSSLAAKLAKLGLADADAALVTLAMLPAELNRTDFIEELALAADQIGRAHV